MFIIKGYTYEGGKGTKVPNMEKNKWMYFCWLLEAAPL